MGLLEIVLIGIGLSMDAFAVSICKGLSMPKMDLRAGLIAGIYFGVFQGLMPLIGFFIGRNFASYVGAFDHYIVFCLLGIIGGKMIYESRQGETCKSFSIRPKEMFPLAIATSIDALAVGVSFSFLQVNIWGAALIIGIITFVLSFVGVKVGNVFGSVYKSKAELLGGVVLILIGTKVLVEHLLQ